MRPPATEKCGNYPTHDHIVNILTTYIVSAETKARLLDPCCSEGKAASMLGASLNCETWGVELSYKRAQEAEKVLDKTYNCPWNSIWINQEAVTFLFLNPPYDTDTIEDKGRLEVEFLRSCTPALASGGLLVYIVPQKLFRRSDVAKKLASSFENFTIGLYSESVFGQAILLATKRESPCVPKEAEIRAIQEWGDTQLDNLEPVKEPVYTLLPAPKRARNGQPISFYRTDWTDSEKAEATLKSGVMKTMAWKDLLNPNRANVSQTIRPVMPLKKGHIAMLMSSGMIGNIRLIDDTGQPLIIKGRVIKTQDSTTSIDDNGDEITKIKDRFVTTITVVTKDGIKVIEDVEGLTQFMKEHGERVAEYILNTYHPLYNMNPTESETAILNTIGKNGKVLPGQSEAGLLTTQRHACIAMARSIRQNKVGNIQGEMGLGKTRVAAGTMALLDKFPVVVLCPPHLVPKWIREIEDTIPGARGYELRRIGQKSEDPYDVNDVRHFLEMVDKGDLGTKPVAVLATTSAKMSSGWRPSVVVRKANTPNSKHRITSCCCPVCGAPVCDSEGYPIRDPEELAKQRLFCHAEVPGWVIDEDGRKARDAEGNPIWGKRKCGNPLFSFDQARRYSIAEYILKHCKGRFKLLVCDECHQEKGKSSDRAVAFHQMVTACNSTLTLTGTFFGGKSTSIFWLLHRLNPGVRRDFGFNEETRWAKLYGVLEITRKNKRSSEEEDGYFTGNRRYANRARELPGISPAIINRLLDTTVFLSLKDLGIKMPEYVEEVADLSMEESQEFQYRNLEETLKSLARDNQRYLSTYLQWTLARPNSGFRDEKIVLDEVDSDGQKTDRKVEIMDLPAVVEGNNQLPKEKWLADFCLSERKRNRKVLVYVRQTGTRDIQDHLQETLTKAGLRVTILHGNVDPRKREEWIAKRTPGTDVLVCNPRLVETGLDLIDYSTVVFAEIEYSLYTLWQAVRRVWRLGQTQAVKAVFCVYDGTMEKKALQLMGRKMKAAQLLYGDEVGGAIVTEDSEDLLTELARDVLSGTDLSDLQTLFSEEVRISHNPVVSMTVSDEIATVSFATWDDWVARHSGQIEVNRKRGRSKPAPEGQASLF